MLLRRLFSPSSRSGAYKWRSQTSSSRWPSFPRKPSVASTARRAVNSSRRRGLSSSGPRAAGCAVQKQLGTLPPGEKPEGGKRFNEAKCAVEDAFQAAEARLAATAARGGETSPAWFDVTLPGRAFRLGHMHPITQTIEELKDIMGRLGFSVADGPEIEDERHNFEALNIPLEHPARDPLDNFYLRHRAARRAAGNCCFAARPAPSRSA